jgi:hypothetical protein
MACLCAAAMLCVSACADIWGFGELRNSPDGGGSGGVGVIASTGGRTAQTGTGGEGSAGISGNGGVVGSGGAAGAVGGVGLAGGASGGISGSGGGGSGGGRTAETGTGGRGSGGISGAGGGSGGRGGAAGAVGTGGGASGGVMGTGGVVGSGGAAGAVGTGGGGSSGMSGTGGCTGTARELLTNPGFEAGESGWMVFVAGNFPLVYEADGGGGNNPAIAAQSPPNLAWFAGYNPADDVLSQSVVIPANAFSITVSFYYSIFTREVSAVENDVMDVQVIAGPQTIPLVHFSDNNPVETWTRFSAALPISLAGQTVTLQFHDTTNANLLTSFYVDTVSVQVVTCP